MRSFNDYFKITKRNFFKGIIVYPSVLLCLYFATDIRFLELSERDILAFVYFLITMIVFPIIDLMIKTSNPNEYEYYEKYEIKNFKPYCELAKNIFKSLFTYPMIMLCLYFAYFLFPLGMLYKNLIALTCFLLTIKLIFPLVDLAVNNFIKLCIIIDKIKNRKCGKH